MPEFTTIPVQEDADAGRCPPNDATITHLPDGDRLDDAFFLTLSQIA